MGSVYRVLWIRKALWIVLFQTINIVRNVQNTLDAPEHFKLPYFYVHSSLRWSFIANPQFAL